MALSNRFFELKTGEAIQAVKEARKIEDNREHQNTSQLESNSWKPALL